MPDYKTIETRADAFRYRRNTFRIGEVLRRGFWVWARKLVPFTALSLVLHAPLIAWAIVLVAGDAPPEAYQRFSAWNTLLVYLVNSLLSAAVTYGVCMELDQRPASMSRVVATGLRRFLPAAAVTLVAGIAVFGGMLLLIVPGLIVMCMVHVAVPASVIERPGVLGALRRSRALTAGNRLRVFGLILLTLVFNAIVAVTLNGVAFGLGDEAGRMMPVSDLARSVLLGPLAAAMVATTYVLLRRQRDGVDAASLAAVFD
jgi:hypothetical protein